MNRVVISFVVSCWFGSFAGALRGAETTTWAIHGEIVSTLGATAGWVVFDDASILAVDCPEDQIPAGAHKVWYEGYLFPALIDCHNHAQWNAIPQWRSGKTYERRYQWQEDPDYIQNVKEPYGKLRAKNIEYAALKYGEIRALIGGTTMLQSTYSAPEPPLLIRNLDSSYAADSRIPDITQITLEDSHRFRVGLASGKTRRIFLHIAEGKRNDQQSREEFEFLETIGLARPGVVVIHGVALQPDDLKRMAANGMYLVWSPKSNLVLYGETARIKEAIDARVTIALAPDWTISGSDNVLEEMKVAERYLRDHRLDRLITPARLFRMVTVDAAQVAGLSERLGAITLGNAADLILAPKVDNDPFVSLLKTKPGDIEAVFVDGVPVYGSAEWLTKWMAPKQDLDQFDALDVQGAKKMVRLLGNPRGAWHAGQRFPQLEVLLRNTLPKLASLIEDDPAE